MLNGDYCSQSAKPRFLSQKFLIEVSTNKCYMDVPNPKSTTYLEVPINTCFIENSDKKLEKCIDD